MYPVQHSLPCQFEPLSDSASVLSLYQTVLHRVLAIILGLLLNPNSQRIFYVLNILIQGAVSLFQKPCDSPTNKKITFYFSYSSGCWPNPDFNLRTLTLTLDPVITC